MFHDSIPNVEEATLLASSSSADKTTPISSSYHSASASVNADSPNDIDPIATLFNNAFVGFLLFRQVKLCILKGI